MAGYSPKTLAAKLGLKAGQRAWFHAMPDSVRADIGEVGLVLLDAPDGAQAAHIFVTARDDMAALLARLRPIIDRDGFVWVSWPKLSAKMSSEVTENVIRAIALPLGWVDIKVCAVDAVWSGLKLVVRKALR